MSKEPWREVPVEPRFVGVDAATVVLGVGERRIRSLVRSGKIRAVAVGPERPGHGPARYLLSLEDLHRVADEALKAGRL